MRLVRGRLSAVLVRSGVLMLLAAATMFALAWFDIIGGKFGQSGHAAVTGFGSVLDVATLPSVPALLTPVSSAALERIVIPSVETDAPIVVKGIDVDGVMQSPDHAEDVAWHDFTARPGSGSNAVFSGHVDYVNVGPAVFWPLKDLNAVRASRSGMPTARP